MLRCCQPMAYRRSVTYCRCVSLPSHQRDLSAIDAELALLSKVRTVVARAGKPTPALWSISSSTNATPALNFKTTDRPRRQLRASMGAHGMRVSRLWAVSVTSSRS